MFFVSIMRGNTPLYTYHRNTMPQALRLENELRATIKRQNLTGLTVKIK
jgi:hypothetical protein